jgi:hypothetical protein
MKANVIAVDPTLAGVDFLRTELRTGFTLTKLALRTSQPDKSSRSRANARRAYDTVVRFTPKVSLSADETKEIKTKLERLRSELKLLGEVI